MKRREFVAAAALLPVLPARAQAQPPLIGVVRVGGSSEEQFAPVFRRDLARLGFEEGKDYGLKLLFAEGDPTRQPALAAELVKQGAALLVAFGNAGTVAAQHATRDVPIVAMANDLVGARLVASMARPGANTTGVSIMGHELEEKRLEVLHEIVPAARRIGVLADTTTTEKATLQKLEVSAGRLGLSLTIAEAQKPPEVAAALERLDSTKVEAVSVLASPFLNGQRGRLIAEMNRRHWPAMWEWPETVEEGGLVSYAPRISLIYRYVAVQVAKVLKGTKPADLPIEQPTVFTLAINTSAAKKIGLQVPEAMLLRADVVVD
jgi:putative ABC transport system substrate-binding protein